MTVAFGLWTLDFGLRLLDFGLFLPGRSSVYIPVSTSEFEVLFVMISFEDRLCFVFRFNERCTCAVSCRDLDDDCGNYDRNW